MFNYTVCKTINIDIFFATCKKIEKQIENFTKEKLLIDVDGSLIQIYESPQGRIRVDNDWDVYAVYVESTIELELDTV